MKVLTAEQMNILDRSTIESGKPGIELMRAAGEAVYELTVSLEEIDTSSNIVIIAGKGNNGGDGFRTGELLHIGGYNAILFLLGRKSDIKGDAGTCMRDALDAGLTLREIEDDLKELAGALDDADLVIDAIFGTGFRGEIEGMYVAVLDKINSSPSTVVAIDIPSGINASTGEMSSHVADADFTVTFGCLKVAHVLPLSRKACGVLIVEDIGFSREVLDSIEPWGNTLTHTDATLLLPQRAYNANKGTSGKVFVLAGSMGMTGAACLASLGAMRAGAGLVWLGCPEGLNDIFEVKLTEVMTLPLPDVTRKRCLAKRGLGQLREYASKADVCAIGPGLGRYFETKELVRRFIGNYKGNVVLDADGINAFEEEIVLLKGAECNIVLTPHPGELARLTGKNIDDITTDPFKAAAETAKTLNKTVLLKGSPSIIALPDGEIWVNITGNEGLATAGTGDVLTGTIAGLAAQGLELTQAAILGAYLHGSAGEKAAEIMGIHGMIAGDVLEMLPITVEQIRRDKQERDSFNG